MCSEKESFEMNENTSNIAREMDSSEKILIQTCQNDVPTNMPSDQNISTEVPIGFQANVQNCVVLLQRLTEDEINQYCFKYTDQVSEDVLNETNSLINRTVFALDNKQNSYETQRTSKIKRNVRDLHHPNQEIFDSYLKQRKRFIRRRNRLSLTSDNSLDMSQDEFDDDSPSKKKRIKRGRKYEYDSEWNPCNTSKHSNTFNKKPKRQVRRPIIESDSSTSEDDDLQYPYMMDETPYDSNSNSSAFQTVPSELDSEQAMSSSVSNTKMCEEQGKTVNKNSSPHSKSDSNISSDILSDIIKGMDECKGSKLSNKIRSNTLTSRPTFTQEKPIQKKRQKRSFEHKVLSENDKESVVCSILKKMVSKICTQQAQSAADSHKFSKKCKWCDTPFSTNKETQTICAICCDLGLAKPAKISDKKKPGPVKQKVVAANKGGKKVSNTMSRVLKNLPKSEMQRLIYAEKTDKSSFEKGYNHCKSLSMPTIKTDDDNNKAKKSVIQIKSGNTNKKTNISNETVKQKFSKNAQSLSDNTNNDKTAVLKPSTKSSNENNSLSGEKFNDNLILMTFPDADKEIIKPPYAMQNKATAIGADKCNGSRATKVLLPKSSTKCAPLAASDEQYQTYLLPPVPTVVVANYSSNDKCGDYRLLNVFYQNEFTSNNSSKNSIGNISKNSVSISTDKTNLNNTALSVIKSPLLTTNSIIYSNNPITTSNPLLSNRSLSISTLPLHTIQPQQSLTSTNIISNSISVLPVVSSVISLSDKSKNLSVENQVGLPNFPHNLFVSDNNFVNSEQLQIKITHVSSENEVNKTFKESQASKTSNLVSHVENIKETDSSISSTPIVQSLPENKNLSTVSPPKTDNVIENAFSKNLLQSKSCIVDHKSSQPSSSSATKETVLGSDNTSKETSSENNSRDQISRRSSEQQKGSDRNPADDPITSAFEVLGAVSILAVIDLERNPPLHGLNFRIRLATTSLEKLKSEKNIDAEIVEKIANGEHNLRVLHIAKKYLNTFGNFSRVSDHFLRKEKMIQIKKEMLSEEEVIENSCRFSQKSQSADSASRNADTEPSIMSDMTSPLSMKSETFGSCQVNEKSASVSHLEKLQSQIAAMNNNNNTNNQIINYDPLSSGTIHHFPGGHIVMQPAVAAPTPITPKNDYMTGGESRETPSRGSGPRTPARPESATSQPEEQSLTAILQIKKERLEAACPSPSQCAFSQATTLPQIPSQLPSITEINPSLNLGHVMNNNNIQVSVSSSGHQVINNNPAYREMAPNRTVPFNNTNPDFSNMLLNIAANQQMSPNTVPVMNPGMQQNRQVVIGQSVYVNSPNIAQKQAVPSINNQYLVRPPYSPNTNGAVLVDHSQMGGQNVNALLTNVSNQQFYTSKIYYPPSSQINNYVPNNMQSTVGNVHNQQLGTEPLDQMVCAVCKNVATLRCKQCAKVAYCNTSCAKTYWHQRHKMECKPMQS